MTWVMNWHLYGTFLVTALILGVTPGPVNILALSHALTLGWVRAVTTVAGATLAIAIQAALAVVGIGSFLALLGQWFDLLRWAGAFYLVYLGVQQWRARGGMAIEAGGAVPVGARFWKGFLISATNPKTLLFFPAFFPQFIDPALPATPQLSLLAASFTAISFLGILLNAVAAHALRRWLQEPSRARLCNRLFGGALVGMGASMLQG
ncbi:LysE family translocator [Inquilinus limosus]|uniref:LysE family translocator n=1 Tax=Inquilinus limosus TaxID=171674 RepID=UPI003F190493